MALSTSDAIFLGNVADADTNEGSFGLENASVYLGSFGSSGAPLHDEVVSVTYDDINNSGDMLTDNMGPEPISYDLGGGTVGGFVDSLVVVNLDVTYTNGSSQSFSNAVMYQDTNGNLFLTNSNFAGTDLNGPSNLPIESINVTSIAGSGFTGLFQNALQSFVCFATGTLIDTSSGPRQVETLRAGDLVRTLDHGLQPIRWAGGKIVPALGRFRPVRIAAGALGAGLPATDLLVSQQHRMLVRSQIAERMFGCVETLVPAKRLIGLPGVELVGQIDVIGYHHFLFDHHEIVFAHGTPAESLLPGRIALASLDIEAQTEIFALFPELMASDQQVPPARIVASGRKQHQLIARHLKNNKPLLSCNAA
ncbi:MAG: Hint domain-containing protein [Pseudomonadota bacterium]